MANEIRVVGQLQITKTGLTVNGSATQNIDMSGSQYAGSVISVGTSYESLPTGDLSDFRYLYLQNQSTASISVALNSTSQSFAVLREDDIAVLPPSGSWTTYLVKATEANADLLMVATEA